MGVTTPENGQLGALLIAHTKLTSMKDTVRGSSIALVYTKTKSIRGKNTSYYSNLVNRVRFSANGMREHIVRAFVGTLTKQSSYSNLQRGSLMPTIKYRRLLPRVGQQMPPMVHLTIQLISWRVDRIWTLLH